MGLELAPGNCSQTYINIPIYLPTYQRWRKHKLPSHSVREVIMKEATTWQCCWLHSSASERRHAPGVTLPDSCHDRWQTSPSCWQRGRHWPCAHQTPVQTAAGTHCQVVRVQMVHEKTDWTDLVILRSQSSSNGGRRTEHMHSARTAIYSWCTSAKFMVQVNLLFHCITINACCM